VLETAQYLVKEFGCVGGDAATVATGSMIESEPRLLQYRARDVEYGSEFLATMMMMVDNRDAVRRICAESPQLLLAAVDGGIQERYVQQVLGAASGATAQANQRIVGNALSSLEILKNRNLKKRNN